MLEEGQIKILMRMHELEQSLAEMYSLFAQKFPEHRELWSVLIKDENEHAEMVQKFYQLMYKKDVFFHEGATRLAAIESIIEFVHKNCDLTHQNRMTAVHALELSRDIEKSMIAKNIFQHFKVRLHLANMLQFLRESSEQHAQLVQQEIDRCKKLQAARKG